MEEQILDIPVDQIQPNPDQPRKEFDESELRSLADSIKEHGVINPITVFPSSNGLVHYTLIDGERRWRASMLAGRETIKSYVRAKNSVKKDSTLVDAIIANSQRSDLNPVEEAECFRKLACLPGFTQTKIASLMGKSQSYVSFRMRLLELEPEIQEFFAKKKIPLDVVVVGGLLNLMPERRLKIARKFAQRGMTVFGMRVSLARLARDDDSDGSIQYEKLKHAPAVEAGTLATGQPSQIIKLVRGDGVVTAWPIVEQAADETCKKCDLFDIASPKMCKDCPAADLIRILTRLATT